MHFVYDSASELLWLEVSLAACQANKIDTDGDAYHQTVEMCAQWGQHSCGSQMAANRIIQRDFPKLSKGGAIFYG